MTMNDIEADNDDKKLEAIITHVNCVDKLAAEHKTTTIPACQGSDTHLVKIQFQRNEDVKYIINSTKELKNFTAAKVYINYHEPYYSR